MDDVRTDVVVDERVVVAVDRGAPAEVEVNGAGAALLPGLHDDHLHLFALAAAAGSVDVSRGWEVLRSAPGTGWIRAVGASDCLDRHALDRVVSQRPVRVQHRSGAVWSLNSAAMDAVAHVLDDSPDVERDADGSPTGRLWRYDVRLRLAIPPVVPDLAGVATRLRKVGITSLTDATPDLDVAAVAALSEFPLPATLLGDPTGTAPAKILLRDHDLPTFAELSDRVAVTHRAGRAVAVHCVTRESLLLTLAVFDTVGRVAGDRIEHAAVVPEETRRRLRGLRVITQPAFTTTRAEQYRRDVDSRDQALLYPYASLLAAGVDVVPSSDAPHGPVDPWQVMRAARDRDLVPTERVKASVALRGYLRHRIEVGAPARLCLLHTRLDEALDALDATVVRLTHVPNVVTS